MGVRVNSFGTTTAVNVLPANATETVIYVTPPFTMPAYSAVIFFRWVINVNTGNGTTALSVRIRRGITAAGFSIGAAPWVSSVSAGFQVEAQGCYFDSAGAMETAYCLTVSQTGATAAGTLNDGCLLVSIL